MGKAGCTNMLSKVVINAGQNPYLQNATRYCCLVKCVEMEFLMQYFASQHLLLLLDQSDIYYRVCTTPEFLGNCWDFIVSIKFNLHCKHLIVQLIEERHFFIPIHHKCFWVLGLENFIFVSWSTHGIHFKSDYCKLCSLL